MAYLVRKLNKKECVDQIGQAENVSQMYADAVTSEFRSKKGTLSTWNIDSLDQINEAALAIAVTSEKVERMDLIVIDTIILDNHGLEYKKTYAGEDIAVPDLQETHYDILNVTIQKLVNCAQVYKDVYQLDNDEGIYIVRLVTGEVEDIIKAANAANRIDIAKLRKGARKLLVVA